MGYRSLWILLGLALALGVAWVLWPTEPTPIEGRVSPAEALSGDAEGFLRADGPRELSFPEDHGPHPGYRTEWWYYTGNVETAEGRRFGYQFTIFRNQLTPPDTAAAEEARTSDWATNQLFLAHLAVGDVENEQHYGAERFSRGAAGLAGAQSPPFRVWLEDWTMAAVDGADATPMRLTAHDDDFGLDLTVDPLKPKVLHGDRGYDPKGADPGNASYYVTFSRMATEGTLTINGEAFDVTGESWMDHEWSTSALMEGQVGWDWFSVQLDNGYDLMYYELREEDGSRSPYTSGTVVDPEGNTVSLAEGDGVLEVLDRWTSPHTGGTYPVRWRLQIPKADLDLEITSVFPDQEMNVSTSYYEGAIDVAGQHAGVEVQGRGFVEMTGYAEDAGQPRF